MSHRILVVGAGAVGGYFGARLVQAGRDVTFLVRPERAAQLRRDGLRVRSPHGDLDMAPRLVTAEALDAPYDIVLCSVKGFALDGALEDMAPAIGPDSVIVPLLNGMRHMARLTERFGAGPVLGGVCLVSTDLDAEGCILQLAEMQQLAFGERDGRITPRVRALDAVLSGAGFEATLAADIEQRMWDKWVFLASLGAATCLLGGSVGAIVAAPGGAAVAAAILDECAAVATACGQPPSTSVQERYRATLTAAGSGLTSSMYRDLRKGARVEADTILGDLVARGPRPASTPRFSAPPMSP